MDSEGHASAVPALLEFAGACFVIAGVLLIWLPLGLIAIGVVLTLLAVALERAAATERPSSRVG